MKRVVRFETETFHEFQLQLGRSGSLAMGIMGDYVGGGMPFDFEMVLIERLCGAMN